MYEKMELERMKFQLEQLKYDKERNEKEYRFRCLEMARNYSCDNAQTLEYAKKFLDFVDGK